MANEKRLIDANKIPYQKSGFPKGEDFDSGLDWAFRQEIDKLPTVDAMEVVHGRWLDVRETEMYVPDMKFTITKTTETCSACKARIGFVGAKQYLFDSVCPNCGAKMDGDGNA